MRKNAARCENVDYGHGGMSYNSAMMSPGMQFGRVDNMNHMPQMPHTPQYGNNISPGQQGHQGPPGQQGNGPTSPAGGYVQNTKPDYYDTVANIQNKAELRNFEPVLPPRPLSPKYETDITNIAPPVNAFHSPGGSGKGNVGPIFGVGQIAFR